MAVSESDLEDALGGEVEGGGGLAGAADPVDQDLAGAVLIVRQIAALPPAGMADRWLSQIYLPVGNA